LLGCSFSHTTYICRLRREGHIRLIEIWGCDMHQELAGKENLLSVSCQEREGRQMSLRVNHTFVRPHCAQPLIYGESRGMGVGGDWRDPPTPDNRLKRSVRGGDKDTTWNPGSRSGTCQCPARFNATPFWLLLVLLLVDTARHC